MSRENVEVVRASWVAYARGDYEASLGAYAEDTVWDDTRYRPDGAVHRGHGALVDVVRTWRGTWERYDVEAEDVLDAGGDRGRAQEREMELTRWGKAAGKLRSNPSSGSPTRSWLTRGASPLGGDQNWHVSRP